MNIEFFWNSGIAGTNHSMFIDGKEILLDNGISSRKEAIDNAIFILKQQYNIDYEPTKIVFKWGGRL